MSKFLLLDGCLRRREFFNSPLPETKMILSLPELGRDVAKLVLCLGGINTVDLYIGLVSFVSISKD